MGEERPRFRHALHGVMFRCRADAEPIELREHVPHPMRLLAAAPDLGQRPLVIVVLRVDEALELIWIRPCRHWYSHKRPHGSWNTPRHRSGRRRELCGWTERL